MSAKEPPTDRQQHFKAKSLDSQQKGLEDIWIALVYRQLEENIKKHTDRMSTIARRGDIQQVAWHARNLLELMIYSKFCAKNRENALRFYKDALRDIIDMNRKHGDELGPEYHETMEIVKKHLNIDDGSAHKFIRIEDAAKQVALDTLYEHDKKPLHKFVHTSALAVAATTIMGDPKLFRAEFVRIGNSYSEDALKYLKSSYMCAIAEKYRRFTNEEVMTGKWRKNVPG